MRCGEGRGDRYIATLILLVKIHKKMIPETLPGVYPLSIAHTLTEMVLIFRKRPV